MEAKLLELLLNRLSPSSRRIVRWAERHAVTLDNAEDALSQALGNAHVVFLAESDHFVHEAHVMRRALLPCLLERGAQAILEEISACDGRHVDRFMATGNPAWLDRVATFGNRAALRTDRDDRLGGLLAERSDRPYPFAGMRFEHEQTLRVIRHCAQVRYVGIDLDALPGGAYEDLVGLNPVVGESRQEEIDRLKRAIVKRAAPISALSALCDGLMFVEATHKATTWKELAPAMAARENGLYARAQEALTHLPDAVVLGHCGHLTRDSQALVQFDTLAGPPKRSLGVRLASNYNVGSVWMLHGEGQSAHPFGDVEQRQRLLPGTLNATLAQVGDRFVLPIRGTEGERLLAKPRLMTWSHGARVRTALARQCDVLVYFRTISPLHTTFGESPS